jgi:hypothetical protein
VLCADLVGNATQCDANLDRVRTTVLCALAAAGGSVISVSRMRVTCWFDADDGLAATACALQIVDAVADIAVLIVGGTDLARVARARELVHAGDVLVDADVVAGAADRLVVIGWLAAGDDQFALVGRLRGGPPDGREQLHSDTITLARNRRVTGPSGDVVSWFVAGRAGG